LRIGCQRIQKRALPIPKAHNSHFCSTATTLLLRKGGAKNGDCLRSFFRLEQFSKAQCALRVCRRERFSARNHNHDRAPRKALGKRAAVEDAQRTRKAGGVISPALYWTRIHAGKNLFKRPGKWA